MALFVFYFLFVAVYLFSFFPAAAIIVLFAASAIYLYCLRCIPFKKRQLPIHLAFAVAGILLAAFRVQQIPSQLPEKGDHIQGEAIVLSVSAKSAVVQISPKEGKHYKVRLSGIQPETTLYRSMPLESFSCKFIPYERNSTFANLEILQQVQGICKIDQALAVPGKIPLVRRLYKHVKNHLDDKLGSPLATGILLADTSALLPWQNDAFQKMGVAHLFSASGLHLGLLFFIIFLPFRQAKLPLTGSIVALIASFVFLALLDYRISLLRAFLFAFSYIALQRMGMRTQAFFILTVTAVVSEILFPLSSFSPSFLLSFGVTAAILASFSLFKKYLPQSIPSGLRDHIALTVSAFSGSVFLSWMFFHNAHPLSFLYNFILVPLTSLYLPIALLSAAIPALSPVVHWLDQIYFFFAWFHRHYVLTGLSEIPAIVIYFWLFGIALLAGVFLFFAARGRQWSVRHYFSWSLLWLMLPLLIQIFLPRERNAFYLFPYGAVSIDSGVLQISGQPASFLKDFRITFPKNIVFHRGSVNANLIKNFTPYFPELKENQNTPQVQGGLLTIEDNCYFFISRANPAYWNTAKISSCREIVLAESKSKPVKIEQWKPVFGYYGFQGKLRTAPYFQWITPD